MKLIAYKKIKNKKTKNRDCYTEKGKRDRQKRERNRETEGRHPDLLPSPYSQSKFQTHSNFRFSSNEYSLFSLPFEFS